MVSAFLFVVIGNAVTLIAAYEGIYSNAYAWVYLNIFLVAVAGIIVVSMKKGPSPKWRWGKKEGDNHHEDF